MIDSNAAVRFWLMSDSAITALVGTNVFWPRLPQGFIPAPGNYAIALSTRGGSAEPEMPIISPSIQIECWAGAGENVKAREIYRAVHDLMHGANMVDLGSNGFVLSSVEEVLGQDSSDPETGWATVVSFYQLMMRA